MLEQPLRARRLATIAIAATVLIGACSAGTSPTPPAATQPPAATPAPSGTPPPASPSAGASAAASVYEVTAATTGSLAPYLTGEGGKTLYTFKKDTANVSNCTGGCASAWPPFTLDPGESTKNGAGVTGTLATFTRADGKMQVTYKGAPLYYFASDTKAGDTSGQGVGGIWFVAKP